MDFVQPYVLASLGGLAVGLVFGYVAWRTQFCVAGSILSIVGAGDSRGFRAVVLASATAILATQMIETAGVINFDESVYRSAVIHWPGYLFGGFAFGYGMILSSGCGAGTLVRLGGGDLRAIVSLVFMGIIGYMTLRGLTGIPRIWVQDVFDFNLAVYGLPTQGMFALLAEMIELPPRVLRWALVLAVVGPMLLYCFRDAAFRAARNGWAGAVVVGLCVAAGWLVTGILGADEFDPTPLVSLTFVAPVANSLQYLMTFTGATVNFGIATVGGVLLGSFLAAVTSRTFQAQYFDGDRDLVNAIVGGSLMGVGGVAAFGCSIGNGLSGMSTLSLGPILATGSILAGAFIAARRQFQPIL